MTNNMKYLGEALALVFLTLLTSCGGAESGATERNLSSAIGNEAHFAKDKIKGCQLTSVDLVANTFSLPVQEIKQTKVMGCIYTWNNEESELKASVMLVQAHKDSRSAASWFANATRSRSPAEVQADLDSVTEQLEFRQDLDATARKVVAQAMLSDVAKKAIVYNDVPGLGDEARSAADGSVMLRFANVTLNVSAYHGAKQPALQLSGLGVNEMVEIAKQHASEWETKTAPQRLQDSVALAQAIVAEL